MIPDAASTSEIVQHAAVSAVALGAVAVLLRRVIGVFESRPAQPPGSSGVGQAAQGCSHCAAGSTKKHTHT